MKKHKLVSPIPQTGNSIIGMLYGIPKTTGVIAGLVAIVSILVVWGCQSSARPKAIGEEDRGTDRTWMVNKADAGSTNYSPLTQINTSNASKLKETWTFEINDLPDGAAPGNSECIPIIIDGIVYATSSRQVTYALDAATGDQLWQFAPLKPEKNSGILSRGCAYWESGNDKRILVTAGHYLFAVDSRNGKFIEGFGNSGRVDMNVGLRDDPRILISQATSPGVVYKDLIVFGTQVNDNYGSSPGYMRAYNCKTGKLAWTFHTIPQPGDPGYETWPKEAYKQVGGANDWAGLSIDQQRGIVYAAIGSPAYDFFGADRLGDNLYSDCVLALDANTGKHIWHYQTVHHDMWDYDLPALPTLVRIQKDDKTIDAVAQITKQSFVFVLDRETGKSLFPVEEKKVPASYLPG